MSPDPLAIARQAARKAWPYAIALVVILVVLGGLFRHSINWGDAPTWILAVTTLLAFVAAAFAGLIAYDLLNIEVQRDLAASKERLQAAADRQQAATDRRQAEIEREADRRLADAERAAQRQAAQRAQASKVTAWFAFDETSEDLVISIRTWGGTVRNASELPIFDVRIFYYRVNDPHDGSPWTAEQCYASVDIIRVIPPGQTRNEELPGRVRSQYEGCDDQLLRCRCRVHRCRRHPLVQERARGPRTSLRRAPGRQPKLPALFRSQQGRATRVTSGSLRPPSTAIFDGSVSTCRQDGGISATHDI